MKAKLGRPKKQIIREEEIDFSTWNFIDPTFGKGQEIGGNEMSTSLIKRLPNSKYVDKVKIRIGKELAERLGWKHADKICFYNDPRDLLSIAAVKRQGGNKLVIEQKGNSVLTAAFRWDNRFMFKTRKGVTCEYKIHDLGYLVFRIEGQKDSPLGE